MDKRFKFLGIFLSFFLCAPLLAAANEDDVLHILIWARSDLSQRVHVLSGSSSAGDALVRGLLSTAGSFLKPQNVKKSDEIRVEAAYRLIEENSETLVMSRPSEGALIQLAASMMGARAVKPEIKDLALKILRESAEEQHSVALGQAAQGLGEEKPRLPATCVIQMALGVSNLLADNPSFQSH